MLRFLVNDKPVTVEDVDPNTTVLEYLREHRRLTGTKEGCASGDCGACTVVLCELWGEEVRYRTINACISLLGHLHGKHLMTVEYLTRDGSLHPVQAALVQSHGSQCGFCTPGFVMSLFAYQQHHNNPDRQSLTEAMSGNLCRCTGYRPILEAGMNTGQLSASKGDTDNARERQQLRSLAREPGNRALRANNCSSRCPATVDELAQIYEREPSARLVAGATDLALEITQNLASLEHMLFIGQIEELSRIERQDNALLLGAAATFTDMESALCEAYPNLAELLHRLGSLQVRNQGTLGGNVANASPIGDMPPVLIALKARLTLRKGDTLREIPVADFFKGYRQTDLAAGEFIVRITLPLPSPGDWFQVYKVSKRLEDDISSVCGAFRLRLDGERIVEACVAYGGMAEIPKRAEEVERALCGQPWSEATVRLAMAALEQDFTPISDCRASAEYRQQVARNLLLRLYREQQLGSERVRLPTHA